MEVLKQPQYSPLPVAEQVVIIYTVVNGYLDDIPVDNIERFQEEFLSFLIPVMRKLSKKLKRNSN